MKIVIICQSQDTRTSASQHNLLSLSLSAFTSFQELEASDIRILILEI